MAKLINVASELPVIFLREGKHVIAYTPALDLSTAGKTHDEAKRRFEEAVEIFFEETVRRGTLEQALLELGWEKKEKHFVPPVVIGQETIRIPKRYADQAGVMEKV